MNSIKIYSPNKNLRGEIILSGSKSISNRVLLIKALCKGQFEIYNLSGSDDTLSMERLINSNNEVLDAHHAGTTYRFLTAYLALKSETHVLTGSERMKQRPVKALVDALNYLGANIQYINEEGYPPIKILPSKGQWKNEISLPANISSQYISALLLIAPVLPNGLTLHLNGEIVSRPYIEMTIGIMYFFGVEVFWENQTISIKHQEYIPRDFYVEADWSAASYYYTIAGLSESADILLKGLHADSLQGDSTISEIGKIFGIESIFGDHQVRLLKTKDFKPPEHFEYNYINVPDIAQSISVLCGGLGTNGLFTGLQTLRIKETDRIAALQTEFAKMQVYLNKMPEKFSKKTAIEYYMQEGKATIESTNFPEIDTYNDHRMAMAYAPLGLLFPIQINDPEVISKSYPGFWKDLESLGFDVK